MSANYPGDLAMATVENPRPPQPAPPHVAGHIIALDTRKTSFAAVASLVFGVMWIFGFGSLVAVLCGHASRSDTRHGRMKGDGVAHAGLILGWLGLGFSALFITVTLADGHLFGIGAEDSTTSIPSSSSYAPSDYSGTDTFECYWSTGVDRFVCSH